VTQPVQEPTQGRANQAIEFRQRQLFRRPSSGGGGASWAQLLTWIHAPYPVSGSSTEIVEWEFFHTNNTDIFSTTNEAESSFNTSLDTRLVIAQAGFCYVDWFMGWDDGIVDVRGHLGGADYASETNGSDPPQWIGAALDRNWGRNAHQAVTIGTDAYFTLEAVNTTAGTKDMIAATMQVVWIPSVSNPESYADTLVFNTPL
jgi:hypothetical protein